MKVTKQTVPPPPLVFTPVAIEIILETAEEQSDWYHLTTNNLAIPTSLRSLGRITADEEIRLTDFMNKLCRPKEKV